MRGAAIHHPVAVALRVAAGEIAEHVARRHSQLAQEHDHRGREVLAVALLDPDEAVHLLRVVRALAARTSVTYSKPPVRKRKSWTATARVVRILLVRVAANLDLACRLAGKLADRPWPDGHVALHPIGIVDPGRGELVAGDPVCAALVADERLDLVRHARLYPVYEARLMKGPPTPLV